MIAEAATSSGRCCFVVMQRLSPIGGIETLVVRLLPYLAEMGPVFVFGTAIAPDVVLPSGCHFVCIGSETDMITRVAKFLNDREGTERTIIVSLHPWSLVAAFAIRWLTRKRALPLRSFHLVTHSRAMFFSGNGPVRALLRHVFLSAPRKSTYFMNDPAREAHEREWKRDLSDFPILQLPLASVARTDTIRTDDDGRLRIVSVGRLVSFKGYNRAAPQIVADLASRGVPAAWTIWGDGEDRDRIAAEIGERNLGDHVHLMGPLAYSEFAVEMEQHDVFVGMGTAVLEAAMTEIPAVCAIENGGRDGYGFLFETPSNSVGDVVAQASRVSIVDTLARVACMNAAERTRVGGLCRVSAEARSHSLQAFAEAIRDAQEWPLRGKPATWLLVTISRLLVRMRDRVIVRLGT